MLHQYELRYLTARQEVLRTRHMQAEPHMAQVRQVEEFTDSGYASGPAVKHPTVAESETRKFRSDRILEAPGHATRTGLQDDDIQTIYSEVSTVFGERIDRYVSEFAGELYRRSCHDNEGIDLQTISELIPDILRELALRIGYKAPTQLHCDVMYFVHRFRR